LNLLSENKKNVVKRYSGIAVKLFLFFIFYLLPFTFLYGVDVYLKLTAHGQRIKIGLANFTSFPADIQNIELARKIQNVTKKDLLFTRYFDIIDLNYVLAEKNPDLKIWQNQNIDVILVGKLKIKEKNCMLTAKLYEVESGEIIFEKDFKGTIENYREIAHEINDEIVLRFTGQRGIAHSKIVFVNDSTGSKEIYVVDYDGFNIKKLTNYNSISIFPKWSPDGSRILFTSFVYGNPDLFVMNADGSGKRAVSTLQGLNTTPAWSPDGNSVILTISKGGSPNLYEIDLNGKYLKRLTFGNSIDTSPYFSPNGKNFVFVSDRPGYPQLYIMDVDGTNIKRIYTDGYSDSPCWSPQGDKIVFTMRQPGFSMFDIYLYEISGGKISQLTFDSGSNESPSFSPDGRFIVFCSTRNKKKEIFVMFVDGSLQYRLFEMKGHSFMPHWSP